MVIVMPKKLAMFKTMGKLARVPYNIKVKIVTVGKFPALAFSNSLNSSVTGKIITNMVRIRAEFPTNSL